MQNFKHKVPVQIRFKDIDRMGHVNNANYLTYIELARVKYFEEVVRVDGRWSPEIGIILARIEIDFKAPVFLHDRISVGTRCSRIGNKSLTLEWAVIRHKEDEKEEVVASGIAVLVYYDYTREETIPVPEAHRAAMEQFEGQGFKP